MEFLGIKKGKRKSKKGKEKRKEDGSPSLGCVRPSIGLFGLLA
jgi:hypothetical protein